MREADLRGSPVLLPLQVSLPRPTSRKDPTDNTQTRMRCQTYLLHPISLVILFHTVVGQKIILTNDDGWAVALIRAQRNALVSSGFDVSCSPCVLFLFLDTVAQKTP